MAKATPKNAKKESTEEPKGSSRNWTVEQRREAFLKTRASFKGDYQLVESDFKEATIPYGHIVFDNVLKLGGISFNGRVFQIHGDEGTGKSTVILYIAAQFQKFTGEPVGFFDFEGTGTTSYNTLLGLDPEMTLFKKPDSIDTAMADILTTLKGGTRFVICDSIPYMQQLVDEKDIMAKKVFKANYGKHAKAIATFYTTLNPFLRKYDGGLFMVNQTRDRIDDSPEAMRATQYSYTNRIYSLPGGRMGRFAPATMLELTMNKELRPWDWKKMPQDKEDFLLIQPAGAEAKTFPTANKVRIRTLKNKITGGGYREGFIYIRPGYGIDEKMSIRDLACTYDLVGFTGGKWVIGNSKDDAIITYANKKELVEDFVIRENPEIYPRLKALLIERLEADDSGRFNASLTKEEMDALSESHVSVMDEENESGVEVVDLTSQARRAFEEVEEE